MRHSIIAGAVAIAFLLAGKSVALAQDTLKLAIGAKGIWDQSISELAQNAGIFRKHGLALEIFYTQGAGETLQAVIAGSADIGVGLGTLGVMGAFAKGAPIRIIGATMTGANDTYLYVPAASPIRSLKDADGKTVAFSTVGSSTHMVVLGLEQLAGVKLKAVATGSATATLTQVMSGQIDVGWAAAPFGVEAVEQGKIRIIARASDVVAFRTQTSRVLAANLGALERRKDVFVRYMRAYREGLDWLYADPAALTAYAQWAGTSERIARRLRDEFLPKADVNPANIAGLRELMAQAVTFKFMPAPLTDAQLQELIQRY
jgi:ABC-type nitrate/sulfonate/bicarbonate transport system substrate-binding protein